MLKNATPWQATQIPALLQADSEATAEMLSATKATLTATLQQLEALRQEFVVMKDAKTAAELQVRLLQQQVQDKQAKSARTQVLYSAH